MADFSRRYQYLKHLSVERLEGLLDSAVNTAEDENREYVDAILNVIVKKEGENPTGCLTDADKVWRDFKTYYNPEDSQGQSLYFSEEQNQFANTALTKHKTLRRIWKTALMAAAVAICLPTSMVIAILPTLAVNEGIEQDLPEINYSGITLDDSMNVAIADEMKFEAHDEGDDDRSMSLYKDVETSNDEAEHREGVLIESEEENSESLYVLTCPCPPEIVEYAKKNVCKAVRAAMRDTGNFWGESEIKLGQPFTYSEFISDMFTFPVYADGEIIYTFRVGYSPYNRICGTFSQFLVEELNEYIGNTSLSNPLRFNIKGKTLYGVLNDETNELAAFHFYDEDSSQSNPRIKESVELVVENLSNYLDIIWI